MENAGLENDGPKNRAGKCRTGIWRTGEQGWKMQDYTQTKININIDVVDINCDL